MVSDRALVVYFGPLCKSTGRVNYRLNRTTYVAC